MSDALGIAVGDRVGRRDEGLRYRVDSIWGPFWWFAFHDYVTIWPYPVISIRLSNWDNRKDAGYGINNIHQDGGRWFTDQGDEILVQKTEKHELVQTDLFAFISDLNQIPDPQKQPYKFDPKVDYTDLKHVFQCYVCNRDFNGERWNGGFANPHCPFGCKSWLSRSIIVMPRLIPGQRAWSVYQISMGYIGQPTQILQDTRHD